MSYVWHHEKTERNVRHMALSKRSQSEKSRVMWKDNCGDSDKTCECRDYEGEGN